MTLPGNDCHNTLLLCGQYIAQITCLSHKGTQKGCQQGSDIFMSILGLSQRQPADSYAGDHHAGLFVRVPFFTWRR